MHIILPNPDILYYKKEKLNVYNISSISIYERIKLKLYLSNSEKKKCSQIFSKLMCNEMKLKEDILLNINTNKTIRFTDGFICREKILKSLLDENELLNISLLAININQFRFHTVNSITYNCELCFVDNTLNGNELLMQFDQVVICLEICNA